MQQTRNTNRLWLWLALVPILLIAAIVAVKLPFTRKVSYSSFHSIEWALGSGESMVFHLESEQLTIKPVTESHFDIRDGKSVSICNVGSSIATISERGSRRVIKRIALPFSDTPQVLGGRFLVWESAKELSALDLEEDEPQLFRLRIPSTIFPLKSLQTIAGTNCFARINSKVGPNGEDMAELFGIQDNQIDLLQTWPVSDFLSSNQEELYSFTPDGLQVECRSTKNGSLIETFPVPTNHESFAGSTTQQSLFGSILVVYTSDLERVMHFDLRRQKYLELAEEDSIPIRSESGEKLLFRGIHYCDRSHIQAYDLRTGKLEQSFILPFACDVIQHPKDGRLVASGDQEGFTIRCLTSEGKVTKTLKPFQWIGFLFTLLLIVFPIWVVAWIQTSAHERNSVWVEVFLLIMLVMGCFGVRVTIGDRYLSPSTDETLQYFDCVLVSSFAMCIVWQLASPGRIVTRLLPLILFADISAILFLLLRKQGIRPRMAFHGPMCIDVIFCCLTGIAIAFALRSFRIRIVHQDFPKVEMNPYRLSLLELLILTTCAAIFLAVWKNEIVSRHSLSHIQRDVVLFVESMGSISVIAFLSCLSGNKWMFRTGLALSTIAGSLLITSILVEFYSGNSLLHHLQGVLFPRTPFFKMIGSNAKLNITPGLESIVRCIETTFVSSFTLALVFRKRGWRMKRSNLTPSR